MRISNRFPPLDDELSISYVMRLAFANGFPNETDFLRAFVSTDNGLQHTNDFCLDTKALADKINIMDPIEQLAQTTVIPALWPLLPASMQDRHIRKAFNGCKRFGSDKVNLLTPQLHYCPECMKQDNYLHRIHNVPGIYYCPFHKSILRNFHDNSEVIPLVSYEAQAAYQELFIALLKKWIKADYRVSKQALAKRVRDMTSVSIYEYLSDILSEYGIDDYSAARLSSSLNSYMPGVPMHILIMLFGTVFPSVDLLMDYLAKVSESFDSEEVSPEEYDLLNRTSFGVIHLRHKACGHSFYTTENSIREGWLCPKCDARLSDQDFFEQIVAHKGRGEYHIKKGYRGLRYKVALEHSCGQLLEVSASKYLYYGAKCACTHTLLLSDADKQVRKAGNFRLLSFSGTDKDATILSEDCGHTFVFHYTKFIQHPCCKACSPRCPDEDMFRKELYDLVGNEYELIGSYTTRLAETMFLHKSCGRTFSMRPSHILTGHRCPCCIRQYRKSEFVEFVDAYTCGRYEVKSFVGKSKALILDKSSGQEMLDERCFILQELTRPTPSSRYPHEKPPDKPLLIASDRVLAAIQELYPDPDSMITTRGIQVSGLSTKQIGRIMANQLTKLNVLERIGPGTYKYKER